MTRRSAKQREFLMRAVGGERNAVCAEQLRACGTSDHVIARRLGVSLEAVERWFDLQDDLLFDGDGAA